MSPTHVTPPVHYTSERIALRNLEVQITGFRHACHGDGAPDARLKLVDALLARHSVSCATGDIDEAEVVAEELVRDWPGDPQFWICLAHMRSAVHRFDDAERAIGIARTVGADADAIAEQTADLLEARGRAREALDLRLSASGASTTERLARIACCRLALGAAELARETFAEALNSYRSVSPIPLCAVIFNWGHAWEHVRDDGRAAEAFRTIVDFMPGHVRGRRALAGCALRAGRVDEAIGAAEHATRLAPGDPISAGLLAIGRRTAGQPDAGAFDRARRLYGAAIDARPEAWAAHAAEFTRSWQAVALGEMLGHQFRAHSEPATDAEPHPSSPTKGH